MRWDVIVVQKTGIYCPAMALRGRGLKREVYWKCACCQHGVIAWLWQGVFTPLDHCRVCKRAVIVVDRGPDPSEARDRKELKHRIETMKTGIYPGTLF